VRAGVAAVLSAVRHDEAQRDRLSKQAVEDVRDITIPKWILRCEQGQEASDVYL
jgi:hypothetical protein